MEYKKIGENLYTNKKHRYIKKTCEYCQSDFYCRLDKTITKKTCDRKCNQDLVEYRNRINLTTYLDDIIIGSMLSDGTIIRNSNGKNYQWSHTCINEDYIDYLISESNIDLKKYKVSPTYKKSCIIKEHHVIKDAFILRSKISTTFTEIRDNWYVGRNKIVPKNITLSPTVLLHWYIGDGNLDNSRGITLCTDSFDFYSILYLMELLNALDFNTYYCESRNRIVIPNARVFEFLRYIGSCPVNSFQYKWDTNITRSYIGRICLNCNDKFNAIQNHQKFCKTICCSEFHKNKKLK